MKTTCSKFGWFPHSEAALVSKAGPKAGNFVPACVAYCSCAIACTQAFYSTFAINYTGWKKPLLSLSTSRVQDVFKSYYNIDDHIGLLCFMMNSWCTKVSDGFFFNQSSV